MKPYAFVIDVIKQLDGFNVSTVDFELHVGQDGYVGTGSSVLNFSIDVSEYKAEKHRQQAFEAMLNREIQE